MNHLHQKYDLTSNNIVHVELDKPTNALLRDNTNNWCYRNGQDYKYYGGPAKQSPVVVSVSIVSKSGDGKWIARKRELGIA